MAHHWLEVDESEAVRGGGKHLLRRNLPGPKQIFLRCRGEVGCNAGIQECKQVKHV